MVIVLNMAAESWPVSDLGKTGMVRVVAALLLATGVPIASAKAEVPADPATTEKLDSRDPSYMRCRKIQVTGSLVKKERICKTNAEWAKVSDEMQRNADNLVGRNRVGFDCRASNLGC